MTSDYVLGFATALALIGALIIVGAAFSGMLS